MKNRMTRSARVVTALTLFACLDAAQASAADLLKLAAGQREIWHGAPAALGQRAGIFKKHNLELELLFTSGAGETIQAVVSGSVDIGVGAGTLGVMGAYARGATIRVIGAESNGDDAYWFVPAQSPVRSMADMKGRTIGYSTTGSSTHASVLGLIDLYKVDAKPTATGGFPATYTQVMSGQIDAGWSAPPYAMQALRRGEIRVIARSIELPMIKDHTIRTIIANKPSLDGNPELYRRFMQAYKETIDWMYSDDAALTIYAEFANISMEDARRIRDEFDPKDMVIPDRVVGLADLVADALKFKFLSRPLTELQLRELVQIPK
jgi:NitT/TauT family transport system substrate-binding protein